jgi:hypothetical protein
MYAKRDIWCGAAQYFIVTTRSAELRTVWKVLFFKVLVHFVNSVLTRERYTRLLINVFVFRLYVTTLLSCFLTFVELKTYYKYISVLYFEYINYMKT